MRRALVFGKLPVHGDFVARGLAAGERDAIDTWLAGSLARARAWAGVAFDTLYDQAPPWRFAMRTGAGWQAGALAASVDGVGRRYPVMTGVDGLRETEIAGTAAAVEALIYAALGEGRDADWLAAAVAGCAGGQDSVWTGDDRWWTVGGGAGAGWTFRAGSLAGARPPRLMQAMLTVSEDGREGAA